MACPYFDPAAPRHRATFAEAAMLPLGDSFAGLCRAQAGAGFDPGDLLQRQYCNLGYARGHCAHFPPGQGPDAVRFAVASDRDGWLAVRFAVESGHWPLAVGSLQFARATGAVTPVPEDPLLERQARAYIAAYRRRKGEPGGA